MKKRKYFYFFVAVLTLFSMFAMTGVAAEAEAEYICNMYGTVWALVPPLVAIILALITKEVYSSLFVGIVTGALFYANFNPGMAYKTMVQDGFIASVASEYNAGILIFLVVLGVIVILMNRAGGSQAYGEWAAKKIKTRKGAILATSALGALIFVDDYFNCLTVGSVMRPVTDKNKVSRAKLSYIIDATAAPICMIAPISSWAAAITGVIEDEGLEMGISGFEMFLRAIPYNLYSLLTIVAVIVITLVGLDFGAMKKHEDNALKGDLYTTPDRPYANVEETAVKKNSKIMDLILPIIVLIVFCIFGMVWTGGIFEGANLINAFADCDASLGLSLGSILALVVIVIFYLIRKSLTFKECMEAIPEGFKSMVPAILILVFAWTLSGMTGLLGADVFVSELFNGQAAGLKWALPAIVFAVALFLAFSTGTSWGTFGILLPIVLKLGLDMDFMMIATSACLAGAVCGDHCSPISDTTIMASTGGQCNHINHVSTQLPYALVVAAISFVGYIVAGLTKSLIITWAVVVVVFAAFVVIMKIRTKDVAEE